MAFPLRDGRDRLLLKPSLGKRSEKKHLQRVKLSVSRAPFFLPKCLLNYRNLQALYFTGMEYDGKVPERAWRVFFGVWECV